MSTQSFNPAIWSGRLLANLNDAHVYKQGLNTDYEGEIKGQGSAVKINSIGRISIFNVTRNNDITDPEQLDLEGQWLVVDKAKGFNFAVDDIDAVQMKASVMDEAMKEAAWGLADTCDVSIADDLVANVASANTLTAATVGYGVGETEPYDVLALMQIALDDSNTPGAGRWVVVPNWYEAYLRKSEMFISFGTDSNKTTLKRGDAIGMAAGFEIRKSNNVPTSGNAHVLVAGYKGSASFAEQINKTEPYRPEKRFSDALKGLHVYGHKVTRPSTLAKINATRGSLS